MIVHGPALITGDMKVSVTPDDGPVALSRFMVRLKISQPVRYVPVGCSVEIEDRPVDGDAA